MIVKELFLSIFVAHCESSSVGRARPCQGRGRGFESRLSLENKKASIMLAFSINCFLLS